MATAKNDNLETQESAPKAAHKAQAPKPAGSKPDKTPAKPKFTLVQTVVIAVIAVVVGLLVGKFALGGTPGLVSGKTTLQESELDSAVGSYTYKGATKTITARQALDQSSGVDKAKQDDGSYRMPSADEVLSCARNSILEDAVAAEGIQVSDEDMATYAKDTLGTDDYATIAQNYGMTEDQVKETVRASAGTKQLYDKVVGSDAGTAPTAPTEPADGNADAATADYGAYIVNLLGDEWDADKGTWAREDGPYYAALKDESFSADSATYNQAQNAYYVAYQQYSQVASAANTTWTNYVNGLLSQANLTIGELVS